LGRGTEAADFAAWQFNKYYVDKIRTGRESEPRKDLEAFIQRLGGRVGYIHATGGMLKYFFSLVPPEV
jgi:hypothetical protein